MKFPIILIFSLIGCKDSDIDSLKKKVELETWAQKLTDCPTAQVKISTYYDCSGGPWDNPSTLVITGCDLKICCNRVQSGWACFSCKPEIPATCP